MTEWSDYDEGEDAGFEAEHPDASKPMCQCGHTREDHDEWLRCFACAGPPCDAPGVTVKRRDHAETWTWNLRCQRHGTLQVNGPIDDWEPDAVAMFRREHAGHTQWGAHHSAAFECQRG